MQFIDSEYHPAKVILFGEYSLLLGSEVLGIPLRTQRAWWSETPGPESVIKNEFFDHLFKLEILDNDKIQMIRDGEIYYRSTIRRGYGIGSSGALSAAIYSFCKKENNELTAESLQSTLATIEKFFHGTSSGFDPLISILNRAILRTNNTTKFVEVSANEVKNLYLLDSGTKRKIKGLVPLYLANAERGPATFKHHVKLSDQLIYQFLNKQDIKNSFKALSAFQLAHMSEMILPEHRDLWQQGLECDDYYFKLCGAGGGGYYLLYSETKMDELNDYQLESIMVS